jgi:MFS family permease
VRSHSSVRWLLGSKFDDLRSDADIYEGVITSYLITYTSFLVIYARFSDLFGKKTMMLVGLAMFIIFSVLCAVSTNMTML